MDLQHFCLLRTGMIDYELHDVVPRAMERRIANITTRFPRLVRELGGAEFRDAFLIMAEVTSYHLLWVMRGTASRLGASTHKLALQLKIS